MRHIRFASGTLERCAANGVLLVAIHSGDGKRRDPMVVGEPGSATLSHTHPLSHQPRTSRSINSVIVEVVMERKLFCARIDSFRMDGLLIATVYSVYHTRRTYRIDSNSLSMADYVSLYR